MPAVDASTAPARRGYGQLLFFAALALGSGIALWQRDGWEAILVAVDQGSGLILAVAPIILGAMLVAGYARALLPQALVARWLGAESGFRGLLLAMAVGMVTPGGPFASFALVVGLAGTGADIGACITYLTAWSVLGLHRLIMWEIPLLGPDLAFLRYASCIALPLLAGVMARLLVRHFGFRPLPDRL
ncbi:hypothetical protein ACFOGJ_18360 [Marinibaculum pumilum]|uniref:Permease n=1 Tax=Marinibaculum pumilum TaxID=1766165 RepID=A0ABV7L3G6_9PROT